MDANEWRKAWDIYANKYDHESNEWLDMGVDEYFRAGFELGQQSRNLPVYTIGDNTTDKLERRSKPRGDVARGLVDAALNGADVKEID